MGLPEMLLIGVVLLVVVGPERIPEVMRTAGKYYGQIRRTADDLRRAFVMEADRMDAEERWKKLQERRAQAEEARKQALAQNPGVADREPHIPTQSVPPPANAPAAGDHDPEAPAPRRPVPRPSAANTPPAGISDDEWSKLPEHVQRMLRQSAAIPPADPE